MKIKIIYDEQKAILEKEQKDAELPEKNKRAKIHNGIVTAVASITLAAMTIGWAFVRKVQFSSVDDILGFVVPLAIVYLMGIALAKVIMKEVVPDDKRYSANVQYYLLTQNKKVIDHSIEDAPEGCVLVVTLEDQDHNTTQENLRPYYLKSETRAKLSEIVVDLVKGIVYKPYEP